MGNRPSAESVSRSESASCQGKSVSSKDISILLQSEYNGLLNLCGLNDKDFGKVVDDHAFRQEIRRTLDVSEEALSRFVKHWVSGKILHPDMRMEVPQISQATKDPKVLKKLAFPLGLLPEYFAEFCKQLPNNSEFPKNIDFSDSLLNSKQVLQLLQVFCEQSVQNRSIDFRDNLQIDGTNECEEIMQRLEELMSRSNVVMLDMPVKISEMKMSQNDLKWEAKLAHCPDLRSLAPSLSDWHADGLHERCSDTLEAAIQRHSGPLPSDMLSAKSLTMRLSEDSFPENPRIQRALLDRVRHEVAWATGLKEPQFLVKLRKGSVWLVVMVCGLNIPVERALVADAVGQAVAEAAGAALAVEAAEVAGAAGAAAAAGAPAAAAVGATAVGATFIVAFIQRRLALARESFGIQNVQGNLIDVEDQAFRIANAEQKERFAHALPGTKRIISLDGGGIKGKTTLFFLAKVHAAITESFQNAGAQVPPDVLSHVFELKLGTSTGGIIALALADQQSPGHIDAQYNRFANEVFGRDPAAFNLSRDGLGKLVRWTPGVGLLGVGGLVALAKKLQGGWYSEAQMEEIFRQSVQTNLRPNASCAYVTTVNMSNGQRHLVGGGCAMIDGLDVRIEAPENNAVTMARMTSAAPGYFVPVRGQGNEYVDGGVHDNNPTRLILRELQQAGLNPQDADEDWQSFVVVSVGCGMFHEDQQQAQEPRGFFWQRVARFVIQNSTECELAHVDAKNLCQARGWPYHRLNIDWRPGGFSCDMDEYRQNKLAFLSEPFLYDRIPPFEFHSFHSTVGNQARGGFNFPRIVDDLLGSDFRQLDL